MKIKTTTEDFNELPIYNQYFIAEWKRKKGYRPTKECEFGEVFEMSLAVTNDLVFDSPSERTTFNNSLQYNEIQMSWDGREPLEILWYELNQKLRRRINQYIVVKGK